MNTLCFMKSTKLVECGLCVLDTADTELKHQTMPSSNQNASSLLSEIDSMHRIRMDYSFFIHF